MITKGLSEERASDLDLKGKQAASRLKKNQMQRTSGPDMLTMFKKAGEAEASKKATAEGEKEGWMRWAY